MCPDISFSQTNFSAGEWSPNFRGRLDDKEYEAALTLCLNYIPNQEQSLTPRSGLKRLGLSYFNEPAILLPFRFSSYEPYVAEFTADDPDFHFGLVQFWANGVPVLMSDPFALVTATTGNPPTFTFQDNRAGVAGLDADHWFDGDFVWLALYSAADIENYGYLVNREFILNVVSSTLGTATFTDAETGSPLSGAITFAGQVRMFKRLQIQTWFNTGGDIRKVEFTAQSRNRYIPDDANDYRSLPDHQVAFLHQAVCPQYLSSSSGIEAGLFQADFLDGPYMDSPGTDIPLTVSGTTGVITITFWKYSATAIYQNESVTWDGTKYYVGLVNDNINHALPTYPASTPFWASLPIAWSGATTYFLGQTAFIAAPLGSSTGVPTVYYSIQAGNINHQPPNLTWWTTTPPAWDVGATYSDGAVVVDAAINYTSLVGANVGNTPASSPTFWLPVDIEAAMDAIYNTQTGWGTRAAFSFLDEPGNDDVDISPGRLIRLKWGYQPWVASHSYALNDLTVYKDNIYKALQTALGKIPDQEPTYWEIQTKTIFWTWAQVTHWTDKYTVSALIRGDDLPTNDTIWEFRLGLYGDAPGWPQTGVYHEGRIWLAGPTPNRFDSGVSNEGFNFSPTATDGTVADNNAIAYVLNTKGNEDIRAMASVAEGILLATSEKEWLVSASNLSDPLTPTSIQAHPTTSFSAARVDVEYAPNCALVVQNGRRRLMEHRSFIEQQSYQSRLNAVDLTRKCQHLTRDGIQRVQYQSLPQPIIWCLPRTILTTVLGDPCIAYPYNVIQVEDPARGTLFGLGYARTPESSYVAPFSFEHGRSLYDGVQQDITGIAVQRGNLDTAEYLYISTCGANNLYHIEMLMPSFDSSPLDDTFNQDGTVDQFGTLSTAFYLDSALMPYGCKIATNGLSCTFYGMHGLAGETVQFTCRGKWIGEYTIASDGSVVVTFITSRFEKTDIGLAMQQNIDNATILPAIINRPAGRTGTTTTGQRFYLDVNGNTGVLEPTTVVDYFHGQFGYAYRRRGKTLRPSSPGANGPAFAKIRRNERMGVYLDGGQEVSIGDTFATLFPLDLQVPRTDGKVSSLAVGYADFVTGIFRDEVNSDHTFDGELCWEQTRPVPGGILAIGGFEGLTDS